MTTSLVWPAWMSPTWTTLACRTLSRCTEAADSTKIRDWMGDKADLKNPGIRDKADRRKAGLGDKVDPKKVGLDKAY